MATIGKVSFLLAAFVPLIMYGLGVIRGADWFHAFDSFGWSHNLYFSVFYFFVLAAGIGYFIVIAFGMKGGGLGLGPWGLLLLIFGGLCAVQFLGNCLDTLGHALPDWPHSLPALLGAEFVFGLISGLMEEDA